MSGHARTSRLIFFCALFFGLMSASLPAARNLHSDGGDPRHPNVLFIAVDDLRNDLGCYGHPLVKTPNIDRLAKRGMRFDRAYCQYPVCNPSRTSLLTGLRPDATGVLSNSTNFRAKLPEVVTLPQLFRQHAYYTASLGKIFHRGLTMEDLRAEMDDKKSWDEARYFQTTGQGHLGEGRNLTGGRLAWCHWLAAEGGDEDQPDGQIAREAIRLLEQQRDRRFFLALGFHKPHDPFIAPKRYFDLYPLDALKLPRDPAGRMPDVPNAIPAGPLEEFARFTDRERREFMRAYYAGVSFTDAQIGKVLDALDRLKLADNTIIVFFGDHGYHLGERGWWNKNTIFELSARAPLIVATPKMTAKGKSSSRLVEFLDIYPTLAELCDLPAPAHLQGRSFSPLLDDPGRPWKKAAFTQVQRGPVAGYSVRTERWRYSEWDEGKQGAELYDHRRDPGEYKNLAQDPKYAGTVTELRKLLQTRHTPQSSMK
jgi:iduronate 2-sulfatase